MNRLDCSLGDNKQKMMFFRESHFNSTVSAQKWDRIKVVCRQPFKINNEVFGLAMFVVLGESDNVDAVANMGQNPARKSESATPRGLEMFKKKAANMTGTPKSPYVPSVLKNLENLRNVTDPDGEERAPITSSSSFNSSTLSRTAKLVVQSNSITGKKNSFQSEAREFLVSCGFEKKSFAEIEGVTFRKVKELWLEKKKCELKKEEKDILKSMSTAYLTKLISNPSKRQREGTDENFPKKKRKVSEQVMQLRKNTDIDELYDDSSSNMRNQIATSDVKKKVVDESDDEDIKEMRKKFNPSSSTPIPTKKPKSPSKATPTLKDIGPTFDLNSSPEISPVKETVRVPVKENPSVPRYNRKHLLSVPHKDLIEKGVLVQVYNYKKDKKLPLKGNLELSAKKGVSVTFFKVGADIHLEYEGRFFVPDILPEHLERVFKNFSQEKVLNDNYPDDLMSLLKISNSVNKDDVKPQAEKRKGSERAETEKEKEKEGEGESVGAVAEESGLCPLCQQTFPLSVLPQHAAACEAPTGPRQANCPICDLEIEQELLEEHANTCAASRFGT